MRIAIVPMLAVMLPLCAAEAAPWGTKPSAPETTFEAARSAKLTCQIEPSTTWSGPLEGPFARVVNDGGNTPMPPAGTVIEVSGMAHEERGSALSLPWSRKASLHAPDQTGLDAAGQGFTWVKADKGADTCSARVISGP